MGSNSLQVVASMVKTRTHYDFVCPGCNTANEAEGPSYADDVTVVCGGCGQMVLVRQPMPMQNVGNQAG